MFHIIWFENTKKYRNTIIVRTHVTLSTDALYRASTLGSEAFKALRMRGGEHRGNDNNNNNKPNNNHTSRCLIVTFLHVVESRKADFHCWDTVCRRSRRTVSA